LLIGPPLPSKAQSGHKLGIFTGLPVFGLDGLSSAAYGPEAALVILGAAGLSYIEPITWIILALLAILYISYRQTIRAYPNAAGSYVVAKENLGTNLGLLAAAALMLDYVLNVAVGISAGVGALVSAVPSLHPHILMLCLIALGLITAANLRGTPEAGWLFAAPTYLFVGSFAIILGAGAIRALASGGHPEPLVQPNHVPLAGAAVGLWLLMRGFASGCTAMTGVEAVSNGVSAFREPQVKYAHRTLTAIVIILGVLLAGIAYLVRAYGISAMNQSEPGYQSVLSQLAGAVIGRGVFYYTAIGAVLAVLTLSANTSFADLPRLCSFVARDRFLPTSFAALGRRLVYTAGIIFLTSSAGILLVCFEGITDRLIPLFAVGAFTAFTLSQAGMVVHWLKAHRSARQPGLLHWVQSHSRIIINGIGAISTAIALAVIVVAKFKEGAWISLLAIPSLIVVFKTVRAYYARLERRIRRIKPLNFKHQVAPLVVMPIEDWNAFSAKALSFAIQISNDVSALHLSAAGTEEPAGLTRLRSRWEHDVHRPAVRAGRKPPQLICLQSEYRRLVEPLLQYIARLQEEFPDRLIAIVIPEFIKVHWWEHLLHNHRGLRLRHALLRHGGPRVVVISVPWYSDRPLDLQEVVKIEEEDGELAATEPVSVRHPD
jgi:amino acid transporter